MGITQTLSEGLKREFEVIITSLEISKLVDEKLSNIAKEAAFLVLDLEKFQFQ